MVKKLRNVNNKCFISIGSIWEIAIKTSLGKLSLKSDFNNIADFLYANQIDILPVNFGHLQHLLILPKYHNDPFERLIIAQSIAEDLDILTKDDKFNLYKVVINWE